MPDTSPEPIDSQHVIGESSTTAPDGSRRGGAPVAGHTVGRLGDTASYRVEGELGTLVLHLTGELDAANADELVGVLLAEEVGSSGRVVADLAGVDFIDSRGLSALHRAHRTLGERFVLGPRSDRVERLLELTGFDAVYGKWPGNSGHAHRSAN